MTEKISIPGQESLSDAERSEAATLGVRACSMCPPNLWPELIEHLKVPGAAVSIGLILKDKPEVEWSAILTETLRATELLRRLFQLA